MVLLSISNKVIYPSWQPIIYSSGSETGQRDGTSLYKDLKTKFELIDDFPTSKFTPQVSLTNKMNLEMKPQSDDAAVEEMDSHEPQKSELGDAAVEETDSSHNSQRSQSDDAAVEKTNYPKNTKSSGFSTSNHQLKLMVYLIVS